MDQAAGLEAQLQGIDEGEEQGAQRAAPGLPLAEDDQRDRRPSRARR